MATPLRRALRTAGFRRLFLAQTISRWGDTFNFIALLLTVQALTGSGLKVAATVGFEIVPVLVFGFLAGAVIDRLPRQRVMIAADVARAAAALMLAVFPTELWVLYLGAFLLSTFSVFFNPAAASVLPGLVHEDDLVGANSALWSGAVVSQIALAPLAGFVVGIAGPSAAFGFNALTFVISAVLLVRLPVQAVETVKGKALLDVVEGLRLVGRTRFLRVLTVVQVLAALSAGATSALLVVLATERLDVTPSMFGWLLTAIGVGAAAGPLVLQRFVHDVRRPVFLFGPYVLRGAVDISLATFRGFVPAVAALGAYGVGTSTGMVTYNTTLQKNVEDRMRGRIFSFYDVVWQGGRLISVAVGGFLADAFNVAAVYIVGGLLLLLAGFVGFAFVSSSELRSPAPHDPSG